MIPFTYSTQRPIRNLPRLLKKYNERGGSIIRYQRVISCLVLSQKSSHYVWVPDHGNCTLRALPDTLITLVFGWWSIFGLFWTIEVLFSNLAGGYDATGELLRATRGGSVAAAQAMIDDEVRERRRQSVRAVLQFLGIVGAVVLFFGTIIKITEWYMDPRRAGRPPEPPVVARARHAASPVSASASTGPTATTRTTTPAANTPAPPPRLQGIFYNAKGRSTAIIDRATLTVGQRAGAYTVLAIEQQAVTLQSAAGEKLVLHLAAAR